ncbi:MAG: hypothetical protein H5T92_05600, partial [Synergistales bacterium]|nr:hypothetical protein [Synergistales bacterium]
MALRILPSDDSIARQLGRLNLRIQDGLDASDSDAASAAAVQYLRQAASHAPNRAFTWSLLAHSAAQAGGLDDTFLRYFRLSVLTGRFEASSILLRSSIALSHWDDLPDEVRAYARQDLRRLWADRHLLNELIRFYLSRNYQEREIILQESFDSDVDRRFFKQVLLKKL